MFSLKQPWSQFYTLHYPDRTQKKLIVLTHMHKTKLHYVLTYFSYNTFVACNKHVTIGLHLAKPLRRSKRISWVDYIRLAKWRHLSTDRLATWLKPVELNCSLGIRVRYAWNLCQYAELNVVSPLQRDRVFHINTQVSHTVSAHSIKLPSLGSSTQISTRSFTE